MDVQITHDVVASLILYFNINCKSQKKTRDSQFCKILICQLMYKIEKCFTHIKGISFRMISNWTLVPSMIAICIINALSQFHADVLYLKYRYINSHREKKGIPKIVRYQYKDYLGIKNRAYVAITFWFPNALECLGVPKKWTIIL